MTGGRREPRYARWSGIERELRRSGVLLIAGVDEVGRGSLAGPVVASAVIMRPGVPALRGVDDSKRLTRREREKLCVRIRERAIAFGVGAPRCGKSTRSTSSTPACWRCVARSPDWRSVPITSSSMAAGSITRRRAHRCHDGRCEVLHVAGLDRREGDSGSADGPVGGAVSGFRVGLQLRLRDA